MGVHCVHNTIKGIELKDKYLKIRITEEELKSLKKAHKKSAIETFSAFVRHILRNFLKE